MENGPFIDGLPIKNGDLHGKLLNNQRVFLSFYFGVPIRVVCPIGMGILLIDPRNDH